MREEVEALNAGLADAVDEARGRAGAATATAGAAAAVSFLKVVLRKREAAFPEGLAAVK